MSLTYMAGQIGCYPQLGLMKEEHQEAVLERRRIRGFTYMEIAYRHAAPK
ncbi:MAG: hypothetical protein OSJ73_21590 [Lachnospiraceae bacterium]|nr:hypothetical protein [Lachnospiraceae bacterium]